MGTKVQQKPEKPYPDFPLTWHPSGTCCKKIKGKLHYFGADADTALKNYLEQRDDLQAGRTPRAKLAADGLTLRHACNFYLNAMRDRHNLGKISTHTFSDHHTTCEKLIEFFGKERAVEDLRPEDFARHLSPTKL